MTAILAAQPLLSGQGTTVTGKVELSGKGKTRSRDLAGAVVWLTPQVDSRSALLSLSSHRVKLLQKRKKFSPHIVVVPAGSQVEFPNQDPFFHNVFSLFEGKRFDLGLYEAGSTRTVVFDRAGVSYIFCNIHPEMSAVVISLKTPYYGVSDREGTIVIPHVPPGAYQMDVWHERVLPETLAGFSQRVLVSGASHALRVLRLMEQPNLSKTHKNKYGKDYDISTGDGLIYKR